MKLLYSDEALADLLRLRTFIAEMMRLWHLVPLKSLCLALSI